MILPIYSALERLDGSLLEAAEDLGCSRLSAFWLVTVPLSEKRHHRGLLPRLHPRPWVSS